MRLSEFNFDLPEELIAQAPLKKRDESRLLVLNKQSGEIKHEKFKNIPNYFQGNEILVRNNSKVIPARLFGVKQNTGAKIELLLNKRQENQKGQVIYECLAKPLKRLNIRDRIFFHETLSALVLDKRNETVVVLFEFDGVFEEVLHKLGKVPLPKYIKRKLNNLDRYQTIYAKEGESAAAPTAGLHFTEEIFEELKSKGVQILDITLNVGLGTFAPVREENVEKHKMHSEEFKIEKRVADIINQAKQDKRKVIALGTTSLRALERAWDVKSGKLIHGKFETDIFIKPGYEFKVVDSLITNFHLPKSTLLMLVSALAGKEKILRAYKEAVKHKYRFFSFGDAMLIV